MAAAGQPPAGAANSSPSENLVLHNVLDQSRSPYVRGHMHNPVAWQMWTPEALALAKKHNRLLFVSIGYAACHWCHVMERESFENEQVARILNEHFIPIKIDREERPDIDRIYMQYVQATTGHGGWPMNVFLTPDLEPLFGGTYWPGPDSISVRHGHPGFLGVLDRVHNIWTTDPERCIASAKDVSRQLKEFAGEGTRNGKSAGKDGVPATTTTETDAAKEEDGPELDLLDEAVAHFVRKYDATYGGFGGAPKFPTPSHLAFLLLLGQFPSPVQDVVGQEECHQSQLMAVHTLRHIIRGGIKDHVGYGVARYSVTRDWSLPHFEKMLYDNAQLLSVYLDAFLMTGDAEMLGGVYDIARYLTSPPIAAPGGGFYSSEDADSYAREGDSEKHEGAFYVWTAEEFMRVVSGQADPASDNGDSDAGAGKVDGNVVADIAARFYGVKPDGNVAPEHDAHNELTHQNVLSITSDPSTVSKETGHPQETVVAALKLARRRLQAYRTSHRPPPALDDKIITSWNGLTIAALARASSVLASIPGAELAAETRDAACRAAAFIKENLYDETTGELSRVYHGSVHSNGSSAAGDPGPAPTPAFTDDYAALIHGLLELYEATFDDSYLQWAEQLQKTQDALFWDDEHGGYFSTRASAPDTLLRLKDAHDGAEPSANGLAAANLFRLGALLGDTPSPPPAAQHDFTARAKATIQAFAVEMAVHPFLFTSLLGSVVAGQLGARSIVVTGQGDAVERAVAKTRLRLKANTGVARVGGEDPSRGAWLRQRNALVSALRPDRAGVQVCAEGRCVEILGLGEAALGRVLKGEAGEEVLGEGATG